MKNKLHLSVSRKIKIIGGKWKGRNIPITRNSKIRPTTNRMREILFSWLNPIISRAICLDCFAGSGALGLESLSRGANKVTFLDNNHICITALMKIMQFFSAYNSEVIYTDCRSWLQQSTTTYNVVFLDPPFQDNIIPEVIFLLEKYNLLEKESWIYIETSKKRNIFNTNIIPNYWVLYHKKITRNVMYYLFLRRS
ncbi:16S rRNA (guanine(966)-N(2))-methyltransferase RsmD [Candidatus Blochmanniella camponoti]|uniref:Ribosomal RNA small subunit methyltransferase D n=1 Tax=Candidatus Blochmanniella camponoti TaxID=108080 RepID=A0AAE9L547_9ENTR|nr:16S rRNA (guanine(966)-N(2))-methyltransferase RsmD [Candidatus Blochmannia herculeanus]URJ24448.1 16S rRNA (guanine(966)-N(2))-methyltransferase RsmD [Candidatus Blochmannia herculeanus]URJ26944.1 16S rRNA (guanine(966)-N(2))-methyltransferase RsmD [Candidatus Blochmannia herculeanus]URJ27803.1 16S rRNA (guanine(966)-N(2))-methyltransferase RsmD [Candidatus Blochmannia herculeanus]